MSNPNMARPGNRSARLEHEPRSCRTVLLLTPTLADAIDAYRLAHGISRNEAVIRLLRVSLPTDYYFSTKSVSD